MFFWGRRMESSASKMALYAGPFPWLPIHGSQPPKMPGGAKPLPAPVNLIHSAHKASQHLRCDFSHLRQVPCEHIFSLYGPLGFWVGGVSRFPTSAYRSGLKFGTHKLEHKYKNPIFFLNEIQPPCRVKEVFRSEFHFMAKPNAIAAIWTWI